jgi:cold shock CspA family protein
MSAAVQASPANLRYLTARFLGTVNNGNESRMLCNSSKGFGFITADGAGRDVFVHAAAIEAAGTRTLNEGYRVIFDVQLAHAARRWRI